VTALLNRELVAEGKPTVNHKRTYRVMRDHQLLLQRHTGKKSTRTHDGQVVTLKSNLRWCSDSFEIRCRNGDVVRVVFSLDCCDRECMRWRATVNAGINGELVRDLMVETVEYRFGEGAQQLPHPVEWLSDNGSCYTAHETVGFGSSLGLLMCTTPAYSPESNGMAEAFVKTPAPRLRVPEQRRHWRGRPRATARWIEDYNEVHPHKGLKMRSPREYLALARAQGQCLIQAAWVSGFTGATPRSRSFSNRLRDRRAFSHSVLARMRAAAGDIKSWSEYPNFKTTVVQRVDHLAVCYRQRRKMTDLARRCTPYRIA
jgi:transposase InsO family protein